MANPISAANAYAAVAKLTSNPAAALAKGAGVQEASDTNFASVLKEAIGSGRPAGAPDFVAHLEKKARRKLTPAGRGRPRKANGQGK